VQTEEFINNLFHDYDSLKRHEYYLKTRELKGRHPGVQPDLHFVRTSAKVLAPQKSSHHKLIPAHHKPTQTPAQRKRAVAAKLVALNERLKHLREVLKELVKAAKGRSGAKTSVDTPKHHREHSKLSPKQKAAAAKRSKAYYQKHKGTPDAQIKVVQEKIKKIQEKIAELRAKLESSHKSAHKKPELKSAVSSTTKK
jgi:chaperonin cofactor prefoldin